MNKKKIIASIVGLVILVVAVSAITSYLVTIKTISDEVGSNVTEEVSEVQQAEVVNEDTGEVQTYVTGGTAVIKPISGETINVKIADDQYNISSDYLSILAQGFGTTAEITADNLVITGDKPSVTQSVNSINAATFSDIFNIYCQIYGEEFKAEGIESIWSPAYTLMKTGSLPEGLSDTYTVTEYDTVESNGITWQFFEVNYDTDTTQYVDEEGNPLPEDEIVQSTVHTQFLVAYSDTEDAVEIMCYEENNDVEVQYQMIKDFLDVK